MNCPNGLDPDYQHKRCRSCGRAIMLVRRSRRSKSRWQHEGDGLRQYRSWHLGTKGSPL